MYLMPFYREIRKMGSLIPEQKNGGEHMLPACRDLLF
jgi:hypothetical protein